MKLMHRAYRGVASLLPAGVLLQTGGCVVDGNTILVDVLTATANNIIGSFVFEFFNLGTNL